MTFRFLLFGTLLLAAGAFVSSAEGLPRTFLTDPARLAEVKTAVAGGSTEFTKAFERLRRDAETALALQPVSVIMKDQTPPSGDKHDYLSMAKYWWPDPSKPDGRPYLRRDGEVNPESEQIADHDNFARVVSAVETLGLAYYFFGSEHYAAHAARLIRTWFLDPATRMNPNLNHAQYIPGLSRGRGYGIIDLRGFPRLIDGLGLMEASPSWTASDSSALHAWIRTYISWLRESENGKEEAATRNNHGTWYDVQLVSLALYAGETELARTVVNEARAKRIAAQILPDGRQPEELARTRSWGYSSMNLEGLCALASLADRAGVDLWGYEAPEGGSIRKAVEYLYPFAAGTAQWKEPEIRKFDPALLIDVFRQASVKYGRKEYARLATSLGGNDDAVRRGTILYRVSPHLDK